ncbi:hypothetical protein O181_042826 [Austropuccinia psidii MF-1]|uniref:Uncharacterized protein n=1 Tax=Austropuccinia psidii MF-1 TaxID=1389203 RepID=A0A9Q3HFG5_9BASI|nr:hypothetical protein [Austropuccinia psidii MF-1]
MQKDHSELYKEFLSSKTKGPGEFFRSSDKLWICCKHHITLNIIADPDLEDHEVWTTPNSSKIIQTIVDVETFMISSKTARLLKGLLKNKQS